MNNKSLKKFGWPQHPSRYFLNRIYNGDIPPPDKFTTTGMSRSELDRFLWPFRIDPLDFETHFGFNLDQPLDHFFENQLHDFVEKFLENNNHPLIEITKRIVKRMGRTGCLYRHGFQPKSPSRVSAESRKKVKKLESEINMLKKLQRKRKRFEKERSLERKETKKIFESLPQEDQHYLRDEYKYAQEDNEFINRGGTFEDFLIIKFKLKIRLFDQMSETHKIRVRIRKILEDLNEINQNLKKDEIDFTEFAGIYKSSAKKLNELDHILTDLRTISM
jgi:hypothetical protein